MGDRGRSWEIAGGASQVAGRNQSWQSGSQQKVPEGDQKEIRRRSEGVRREVRRSQRSEGVRRSQKESEGVRGQKESGAHVVPRRRFLTRKETISPLAGSSTCT